MASGTRKAIETISNALDMSRKPRMQRAADQGFDADNVYYHGTRQGNDLLSIDRQGGGNVEGVYFSRNPDEANKYTKQDGKMSGAVYPVHLRGKLASRADLDSVWKPGQTPKERQEILRGMGFDGLDDEFMDEIVVFDPKNIRSVNAAFDPAKRESANLLAGATGAAVGLGALSQSDDAEAGPITRGGKRIIESWHGGPHKYAAERLIRKADGSQEYIVGSVDRLPDIPEGAELVEDFPLGRMRMDKIGSGEGAQAYGHGLYTADSEGVARQYQDQLTNYAITLDGVQIDAANMTRGSLKRQFPDLGEEEISALHATARSAFTDPRKGGIKRAVEASEEMVDMYSEALRSIDPSDKDYAKIAKELDYYEREVAGIKKLGGRLEDSQGALYRTHLDVDPDTLLDWDKPLSEQSEAVKDAAAELLTIETGLVPGHPNFDSMVQNTRAQMDASGMLGGEFMQKAQKAGNVMGAIGEHQASPFMRRGDEFASSFLKDRGIPGIRYLDGTSRNAGEGTSNYVMFDDSKISIQERGYADPALLAGMAASSIAAYSQLREEKKSFYQQAKQDIQAGALSAIEAINNVAFNVALPALDIPAQGYLGLAGVAGTLAGGGSWEDAIRQGAVNATRFPEETTYEMGGVVTDALAPHVPAPVAAGAGTAVHSLGLLGVNALADPVPLP